MLINKDVITSRNNDLIKWAVSLADKKGRQLSSSFIVEGVKLSFEALQRRLPVTHIFINENKKDDILERLLHEFNVPEFDHINVIIVSDSAFEKISTEKSPQGIITVIKYLDFFYNNDIIYKEDYLLDKNEKVIVLCSVRDPLNLGSVIRSAVAFGVEHIIISDDCADIYNTKTIRSAMGSMFGIRITSVSDISDFIVHARKRGRRVYCAELREGAKSIKDIDLDPSDIFIIGNEGHGIPKNISEQCDLSVYIPISNNTESLNASVAAAIFMWEIGK